MGRWGRGDSARRALTIVFLAHGVLCATWASRIPAVKAGIGLTNGELGIALIGGTVGGVSSLLVAAWLVARLGTSRVLTATFVPGAVALPVVALAGSQLALAATLALFGFLLGLVDVAMNAKGVALERLRSRQLLSGLHAGWSAGNIIGAMGGIAAARAGIGVGTHFTIAAIVACALALPGMSRLAVLSPPPEPRRSALVLPPLALLPLAALSFCGQFGESAGFDWSAVLVTDGAHGTQAAGAAGFAVLAAAMTITRSVGDLLVRRLGPVRLIASGGAIAATGMALAIATSSVVLSAAGLALLGVGVATVVPVVYRAAGTWPGLSPATGVAMLSTVGYASFVIAPPVVGLLADRVGIQSALWLVVGVVALVVPLSPVLRPRAAQ